MGPTLSLPDFSQWGPVEPRELNKIARTSAERLSHAWRTIPHVTQHDTADITDLEAGRRRQSDSGPKITMTVLALKAAVIALREFPQFNSSLDQAAGRLVLKGYYHIGVAVDTEHGLLVPVIRDADRKTIVQLASELAEAAELARQRKLSPDQMKGGTFTITNLGGIGGTTFTPIINPPEVAILGMCRATRQAVVRDEAVAIRLILPLSLSYDHRVINGADGARFLRRVAELLSDPFLLLSEA